MNEDFSSIFEKLNINKDSISPEMINNILNIVNNSSDTNESIDIETIMKINCYHNCCQVFGGERIPVRVR